MQLDVLEGFIAAISIIPYPPGPVWVWVFVHPPTHPPTHPPSPNHTNPTTVGIPMVMSGEVLGPAQVAYLCAMEAFDRAFPGFEVEIQVRACNGGVD